LEIKLARIPDPDAEGARLEVLPTLVITQQHVGYGVAGGQAGITEDTEEVVRQVPVEASTCGSSRPP